MASRQGEGTLQGHEAWSRGFDLLPVELEVFGPLSQLDRNGIGGALIEQVWAGPTMWKWPKRKAVPQTIRFE